MKKTNTNNYRTIISLRNKLLLLMIVRQNKGNQLFHDFQHTDIWTIDKFLKLNTSIKNTILQN